MTGVHRPDRPAHLRWRKASASSIGNCVEVAADCGEVLLRDSKDPTGPWIRYTAAEWVKAQRQSPRLMNLTPLNRTRATAAGAAR